MFRILLIVATLALGSTAYGQCANGQCQLQPRRAPVASAVRFTTSVPQRAVYAHQGRSYRTVRYQAPRRFFVIRGGGCGCASCGCR